MEENKIIIYQTEDGQTREGTCAKNAHVQLIATAKEYLTVQKEETNNLWYSHFLRLPLNKRNN